MISSCGNPRFRVGISIYGGKENTKMAIDRMSMRFGKVRDMLGVEMLNVRGGDGVEACALGSRETTRRRVKWKSR